MSFLNKILKRGERKTKAQEKTAAVSGPEKKTASEKSGKTPLILGVIERPHFTEKASFLAERNTYVFSVAKNAGKLQIKKAIEAQYGVNVERVNIVRLPGKERKRGRQIGWKPGLKKAMVAVRKGQKIEFI